MPDTALTPLTSASRRPTSERPLLGLTVLVVEDSRFACEAFRLLCLRSGARIRRADCLASARRHLAVYRPTVVIVDLGLPDGSGADLIREIAGLGVRIPVILGTSGDSMLEAEALAAGADGFLEKPILNLSHFQEKILSFLPNSDRPQGPRVVGFDKVDPDPIALRDDLNHVSDILSVGPDSQMLDYVAQFLASVAVSATDKPLADAAQSLLLVQSKGAAPGPAIRQICDLVHERLIGHAPI